jgi:glycosyltransferase involved in cell wall biosynthesis
MKISIVTISFNQVDYIERAIKSVIKQRDKVDLEYIVVDAGSTDGSREIIESYKDEINHIVFESDEGPSDGLNKGFKLATGNIFGYLNADDEFSDGSLVEVLSFFQDNANIDVISGHGFIIDENSSIIQKCFSHNFSLKKYTEGLCVLVQQSTFFTSNIFKKCGGFNKLNTVSWDGELAVDMCIHRAKFNRVNRFWSKFRVYPTSISGSGDFIEKAKAEHEKIAKKIGYKKLNPLSRTAFWAISRALDPITSYQRIIDALKSGKRVIPR